MKGTLERLVRLIERQRDTQGERCHLLITRQLDSNDIFAGYKSLAALLQAGYFSTIVTTNTDTLLERALEELNIIPPACQIIVFGRDPDEKVAIALDGQERGICIVKFPMHGNVKFADEIQDSLRSYLREDIIVVGYINGCHRDVIQTLSVERDKSSIYYIVPAEPNADTLLSRLQKRYKQYENFLIYGPDGKFVNFFDKLARLLLHNSPLSSEHDIISDEGQHDKPEGEATSTSNADDHTSSPGQIDEATQFPVVPKASRKEPIEPVTTRDASEYKELLGSDAEPLEAVTHGSGPLGDESIQTGPLGPPFDSLKDAILMLPWPTGVDVLIVTVTHVELKAVLTRYPERVRRRIGEKTYYDLGYVGSVRTVAMQANDTGPLEAHVTVDEGIRALSPRAVIMTGIAFGVRTKEQQIGDVLVSKLIHDYDSERVGTDKDDQLLTHQRGTRVPASGWLIDRFNAGNHDWPRPPEIHFGAILSGSKLVDNREYQNALLRSAPDAIGGEMEGVGLSKAAIRRQVSWLLVKGISDWGDGTKRENKAVNQRLAAENAANFVLFVIGQEDFMHES